MDVREMFQRRLVEAGRLLEYFSGVGPRLYRYPAIDAKSFCLAVDEAVRRFSR